MNVANFAPPIHIINSENFQLLVEDKPEAVLGNPYTWEQMYYYLSAHFTYCIHCGYLAPDIDQCEDSRGDPICEYCALPD